MNTYIFVTRILLYLLTLVSEENIPTEIKGNNKQIPVNYMHMTFLAGLRGAVAYGLAYAFPDVHGNR